MKPLVLAVVKTINLDVKKHENVVILNAALMLEQGPLAGTVTERQAHICDTGNEYLH